MQHSKGGASSTDDVDRQQALLDDDDLQMTASANDILEVSPVNTMDSDNFKEAKEILASSSQLADAAENESSSSNDNPEEATEFTALGLATSDSAPNHAANNASNRLTDDAFSSSSSEDDSDQDENGPLPKVASQRAFGSEFDRALHRGGGQPSKGNLEGVAAATAAAAATALGIPPPPPPPPQMRSNSNSPVPPGMSQMHSESGIAGSDTHQQHLLNTSTTTSVTGATSTASMALTDDPLNSGVLPDVLMTMRQKIESLTLFDSDMMKLAESGMDARNPYGIEDATDRETRESLKRSSQQSISAAVLVSLAHKRYERRRLAAMEIEKVVRSLVQQDELDRVRAILLLLSDDYVRSTSEDARKGGVVALAASAIGLKKAPESNWIAHECRDLILASVVHACQDHSQRVRYYATESLFNVVKVIPSLAVQHFFILFEILRSLYADVDVDVKSGAELLDKKLKEVIVGAMNSGQFTADACVPVFARFVYMRNKATKRLTLTWLQELAEKLIGAPILEFLHLLLGGIFDMVADPTLAIRQSALAFLQSVLPKLLTVDDQIQEEAIDDMGEGIKVDFDKILQSLVTTMEHPDPFVRKVAMYWMSRIVKAHIGGPQKSRIQNETTQQQQESTEVDGEVASPKKEEENGDTPLQLSAATLSVRNSLPHVLPGILLSIGDTFRSNNMIKDSFLPDQTTHALADQTNECLQEAVRRDGPAYVHHLDSFIVALREELDSPGGVNARNPPAMERKPYRMDVKHDGTGIESQGWFRASKDTRQDDVDSMMMSRLCALHWVIVLYESVVPNVLKADYAREFIIPIIHQLVDNPPEQIIFKSLEVLAIITVPVEGEAGFTRNLAKVPMALPAPTIDEHSSSSNSPMADAHVAFALGILDNNERLLKSRDRDVFEVLIQLHAHNLHLIGDVSKVIAYMCRLQPPEFVFVSFAVELERFAERRSIHSGTQDQQLSRDLQFVSSFIQQMCHVLLNAKEAKGLRDNLKDCIGRRGKSDTDRRKARLFYVLLHCFSHNLVSSLALCLWGGAYRTASLVIRNIDTLDIHLVFLLELDKLIEMIERPLFRHLHVRMLENDRDPLGEGSGTMLFQALKSLLMVIPQSSCYNLLQDRLVSTSRFRQSVISVKVEDQELHLSRETEQLVNRVLDMREMHCLALWETIRVESLETVKPEKTQEEKKQELHEEGSDRREWLGYSSKEDERVAKARYREDQRRRQASGVVIEEVGKGYDAFGQMENTAKELLPNTTKDEAWKDYWATGTQ